MAIQNKIKKTPQNANSNGKNTSQGSTIYIISCKVDDVCSPK